MHPRLRSLWTHLQEEAWSYPLALFVATRVALYLLITLYQGFLPVAPANHPSLRQAVSVWDGKAYLEIATNGYFYTTATDTNTVFFPLYPLLGRAVGALLGSPYLGLLVVTQVAFLVALLLLYRVVARDYDPGVARRACLYLCLFPTSYVFVSLYQESLFLALVLGCMWLAKQQRWLPAAALAGLAMLTRNGFVGGCCIAALGVEFLHQRGWRGLWSRDVLKLAVAPVIAGLWPLYLGLVFGHPLAPINATAHGSTTFTGLFVSITKMVDYIQQSTPGSYNRSLAIITLGYLGLLLLALLLGLRRLRPSHLTYALCMVALTTAITASFPSVPLWSFVRYLTLFFPFFIMLAVWGRHLLVHALLLFTFAVLYGIFAMFFFCGVWIN